jgi:Major capsid protein Gp23
MYQNQGIMDIGLRLAETSYQDGGWKEYFSESDQGDMRIQNDMTRATCAILLENAKVWMAQMCRTKLDAKGRLNVNEATRSVMVGGFSDYLYPMIRAAFPTSILNDIVTVQPTMRRTSTLVHWNWIVGRGKGSYTAGTRLFDANKGKQDIGYNFSNDVVDAEPTPALGSANATYSGVLQFNDGGGIRPGTVSIALTLTVGGTVVFSDNGVGGFTATGATISASSINYATGAYSITIGVTTFAAVAGSATYRWDNEGSDLIPQVDVQIVTSTIETERRALIANYSNESAFDVMAEFGQALEPQLMTGMAEQLNFEIARQVIHQIWVVAPVVDTFAITGPVEYSQQEHFRDITYPLNKLSNSIETKTRKGYGNWLICDEGACNLIEALPSTMFVAAPRPANVNGPHFIGTLQNRYRVYKDLSLSKETGASVHGNILMGFKGTQFFEAGFVWSPYRLMYTTDTLETANMMSQKGMASRYATKMVNRDMYCRLNLAA